MTTETAKTVSVEALDGRTKIDRESGSLVVIRRFRVTRPGKSAHVVEIEVSGDSGTPQGDRCDCEGWRFRRHCSHVDAVYEAGVLAAEWE